MAADPGASGSDPQYLDGRYPIRPSPCGGAVGAEAGTAREHPEADEGCECSL